MEDAPTESQREIPEVSPEILKEIQDATDSIQQLIEMTDLDPAHLGKALSAAKEVYERHKDLNGGENYDAALDALSEIIVDTEFLRNQVEKESATHPGSSHD